MTTTITRPINITVASSIQTIAFFEYLLTFSVPIYIIFMSLFVLIDTPNIDYYFGLIALLGYQFACSGITYRLDPQDYPRIVSLFRWFFTLVVLGETALISFMIHTLQFSVLFKVILILMLVKNSIFIPIGIIGYWYLKNYVYSRYNHATDFHRDTMRLLTKSGAPKYLYRFTDEIDNEI